MKIKKIRTFSLITGAALLAGNAVAQSDGGWDISFQKKFYVGLGAGSSVLTPKTDGTSYTLQDDTGSATTGLIGFDFNRRISVELQYTDLGEAGLVDEDTAETAAITYEETSLSGLYYLWNGFADDEYLDYDGLDRRAGLSLFGRLGLGHMENSAVGNVLYSRSNDVQVLAGLGVEYGFENGLGARAEYIRFDTDAEYAGLSVLYRFGSGGAAPVVTTEQELPTLPAPDPITKLPPTPPAAPEELTLLAESEAETTDMAMVDSDADGIEDTYDNCPDTMSGTPVNNTGCEVFNGVIEGVNFLSGSDTLTDGAQSALNDVVGIMAAFPGVRLSVEAHTDSRGEEKTNLELSRLRALSVVRYLISQGVDIDRLRARAYGEARPIADNSTSEGRLLNRRVEFLTQ